MAGFRAPVAGWQIAGGIGGDLRRQTTITVDSGTGVLLGNPATGASQPVATTWDHADLTIDFDFLLTPGARFSVWLQGRYPVEFSAHESGRIGGGAGQTPAVDAGRAPGLWQRVHIEFTAPHFDAGGTKILNARFHRIAVNDFTVQSDVEVAAPAGGTTMPAESPAGPLVWRDVSGGPIALRNISYYRPSAPQVRLGGLGYKVYAGEFNRFGEYDGSTPKATGIPGRFSQAAVEKSGRFSLVLTGSIDVPQDGAYTFSVQAVDPVRWMVDDRLVVTSADRGEVSGIAQLTAGAHSFRLDYLRGATHNHPALELAISSPGGGWQLLTSPDSSPPSPVLLPLKSDPTDHVLVQRGFVPFQPRKRLYGVCVGTLQGVNYAYDLETTALLRVWRGHFLDVAEMWGGRGETQYAKAAGPALTLSGLSAVALIETPQSDGWPDRPDPLMTPQGYTLEADGQPVFLTRLADISIRDRIVPSADGRGLARTMEFSGKFPDWQACVLLADADSIAAQPDGTGWVIGDRAYYIDWPKESAHQPVVRSRGGRQLLVVPLSRTTYGIPVSYELAW